MNTISKHSATGKWNSPSKSDNSMNENKTSHNHGETLEADLCPAASASQVEAGFWKHRKAVRQTLNDISYTGLPALDPVKFQALAQLVESYDKTIEETASYKVNQKLANQKLARMGMTNDYCIKEIVDMVAGTGDVLDSAELKRRQLMIAESPNATPEILAELAVSVFVEVREAVVDHRFCPLSVLLMIAEDDSTDLRFALAENHNLPFTVIEKLSRDDNPFVAVRAERTMRRLLSDNVICLELEADDDAPPQTAAI